MKTPSFSYKDAAILWLLVVPIAVLASPLLLGFVLLRITWDKLILRIYTRGTVQQAWERCTQVFRERGVVIVQAGHVELEFPHALSRALGRHHHAHNQFFRKKLQDRDPLLAAYAFKCLVHACDLQRKDIPRKVMKRQDRIPMQWADLVDGMTLSQFFENYFRQQEIKTGSTMILAEILEEETDIHAGTSPTQFLARRAGDLH